MHYKYYYLIIINKDVKRGQILNARAKHSSPMPTPGNQSQDQDQGQRLKYKLTLIMRHCHSVGLSRRWHQQGLSFPLYIQFFTDLVVVAVNLVRELL